MEHKKMKKNDVLVQYFFQTYCFFFILLLYLVIAVFIIVSILPLYNSRFVKNKMKQ